MHPVHGGRIEEFARTFGHAPSQVVDFSANTNLLFDPQRIQSWLQDSLKTAFRYPDPTYSRLRQALANRHDVLPENILPTNGSTELIYLLARLFRGRKALIFAPAFNEYEAACGAESLSCVFEAALEKDRFVFWRPEQIEKIGLEKPQIAFIANPGNPSGRLVSPDWMSRLVLACERNRTLLVIDEAFMDFVRDSKGRSLAAKGAKSRQVLVMRSLTKFFCVPGLRIGYAVGHPQILESLRRLQPTWSVNALAEDMAIRIANHFDVEHLPLGAVEEARARFLAALRAVPGLRPYPSEANFLLCRLEEKPGDLPRLQEYLGRNRILVRFCSDFRGLDSGAFMRVAVRRDAENEALAETLKRAFSYAG